jgi:uncharacterized protein
MSSRPPRIDGKLLAEVLVNLSTQPQFRRGLEGLSKSLDSAGRDLYEDCGYPENPTVRDFRLLVSRNGIARRANDAFADESWALHPDLYEDPDDNVTTPFEAAWKDLNRGGRVWHYLHRADRESGIGRYGTLLLGLDDTSPEDPEALSRPVAGFNDYGPLSRTVGRPAARQLLYMTPLGEDNAVVSALDRNPGSPRFQWPLGYSVYFASYEEQDGQGPTAPSTLWLPAGSQTKVVRESTNVHWTRVLHLAENRRSNETYGDYRLGPVLNYLLDLQKVGGSSAEMFWKGGFPGWAFEGYPDLAGQTELDEDSVRDQLERYMQRLQRYLASTGGKWTLLAPQVADPTSHAMLQLLLISATLGIPMRILIGTEAAHLASTQDAGRWNFRVRERQVKYLEPMVIIPFVDRMVAFGVLPKPDKPLRVDWYDLNTMSDKDRADIALKKSQALMQYAASGCYLLIRPLDYLVTILGIDSDKAKSIVTNAGGEDAIVAALKEVAKSNKPMGGGRVGNAPAGDVGKPAGKVPAA